MMRPKTNYTYSQTSGHCNDFVEPISSARLHGSWLPKSEQKKIEFFQKFLKYYVRFGTLGFRLKI